MKVLVFGSNNFKNYQTFMRAMGVALSDTKDEFVLYSAGPATINNYAREFINVAENGMRGRGLKGYVHQIPVGEAKRMMPELDAVYFFEKPYEKTNHYLISLAEGMDKDVKIFRY